MAAKTARKAETIAQELFVEVTDTIREAARIPQDRGSRPKRPARSVRSSTVEPPSRGASIRSACESVSVMRVRQDPNVFAFGNQHEDAGVKEASGRMTPKDDDHAAAPDGAHGARARGSDGS